MKNNKTKQIMGFLALFSIFLVTSCKEQPKERLVEKEVIVVPPANVVIEKEAPDTSATIKLDKNGLKIDTKKVDVKIE